MQLLRHSMSRRELLTAFVVAGAAIVVGCGDEEKEGPGVTQLMQASGDFLILRSPEIQALDKNYEVIPTIVWALLLAKREREIPAVVEQFLQRAATTAADPLELLWRYDQLLMLELATGRVRSHQLRNTHLAEILRQGLLNNENHRMAKTLLLNLWLEKQGKSDPVVSVELKQRLEINRQELGWGIQVVA